MVEMSSLATERRMFKRGGSFVRDSGLHPRIANLGGEGGRRGRCSGIRSAEHLAAHMRRAVPRRSAGSSGDDGAAVGGVTGAERSQAAIARRSTVEGRGG